MPFKQGGVSISLLLKVRPQMQAARLGQGFVGPGVLGWLVVVGIALAGCARAPRPAGSPFWERVTSFRKAQEENELRPATASANVAQSVDLSADDSPVGLAVLSDHTPFETSDPELFPDDTAPIVDGFLAESWPTAELPPSPEEDQRLQELKHALQADVDQLLSSEDTSRTPHPLRLRVDALLRRARDLLNVGRLSEARRSAQLAVDLSDAVALEFLPSEERPVDLLREIDERLVLEQPENPASFGSEHDTAQSDDSDHSQGGMTWEPSTASGMEASRVAANVPLGRPANLAPRLERAPPTELIFETMPESALHPGLAEDATEPEPAVPLQWEEQGLDEGSRLPAPHAPHPPQLGSIEPLPAFQEQGGRVEGGTAWIQKEFHGAPGNSFYWTDVLPMVALLVVLFIFGTGLSIRAWRQRRLAAAWSQTCNENSSSHRTATSAKSELDLSSGP